MTEVKTVFKYKTKSPRGIVYVHVLKLSPVDIFGIVTFYERGGEGAEESYAASSLLWASASMLIEEAQNNYLDEGEGNPFTELLNNKAAIKRLKKTLQDGGD